MKIHQPEARYSTLPAGSSCRVLRFQPRLAIRASLALTVYVACCLLPCSGRAQSVLSPADSSIPVIGEVVAWGFNTSGQTNVPPGLSNVIAIAASSVHNLVLTSDGMLHAWGANRHGETNVPPGLSNVVGIAAAGYYWNEYGYCLALESDGNVTGWGAVNLPAGLSNVVAVAAGADWWMALKNDGTVASDYSNVTDGLLTLAGVPVSNVVAVASGGGHCLALRRDGTVIGWGRNYDGQATGVPSGSGFVEGIVALDGEVLTNVMAITAGGEHSAALKHDGTVVAWGNNDRGQTDVPSNLSNVVALAKGGNEITDQVLAVQADGTLAAWGGNPAQTNVPPGLSNVLAAAVGSAHSMVLLGAAPPPSHVRLEGLTGTAGSVSFEFPTQSGKVYSPELKDPLGGDAWIPAPLQAGTGHLQTSTDTNATSQARFYRVSHW